jgi:hypothetical protein
MNLWSTLGGTLVAQVPVDAAPDSNRYGISSPKAA